MNTLSKVPESNYNVVIQEKNINNFERIIINEFERIIGEFISFVDEKYYFYMAKQDKTENEIQRCEKFRELKLYISNPISQERKIIGMAENKSNVLTVEYKKDVKLNISMKDIEGASAILKNIKKSSFLDSAEGQIILSEFIDKVLQRTSDGHFKVDAFTKFFSLEFENFSVLSWERCLIHFTKSRPEKTPSFNEILTVLEKNEYGNISLQEKINFLTIFKQ